MPAAADFVTNINAAIKAAKTHISAAQNRQKQHADRGRRELQFEPGDRVMLSTKNTPIAQGPAYKLKPRFTGPFKVIDVVSPVAYRLQLPSSWRVHDVFHVSCLAPFRDGTDDFPTRQRQRPPPPVFDPQIGESYIADCLLGRRFNRSTRQHEYLVKWKGYPDHEATYQPYNHLNPALRREARQLTATDTADTANAATDDCRRRRRGRR